MPSRLTISLLLAVLFIGGALWQRFSNTEYVQQDLLAIKDTETISYTNDELVQDFLKPRTSTSTSTSSEPLSEPDVLGRSLITDYFNLAAQGDVSNENIANLADRYVDVISVVNKADSLTPKDLLVIANSKTALESYRNKFISIHILYSQKISGGQKLGTVFTAMSPETYKLTSVFSLAYKDAALALKNLPVPAPLIETHLALINIYLSSSLAWSKIAETEADPTAAFAGLVTLNKNLADEEIVIEKMGQILTLNGI